MAAMVVIMMGRKRSMQAAWIASAALSSRSRCVSSATSTIMMAFLRTMPIRRITAMRAMSVNGSPQRSSASTAPMPLEGSVERMVIGWTRLS